MSDGSTSRAVSSSAWSACADANPAAGTPVISAVRNRLKRLVNSGPDAGRVVTSVSIGTIAPDWLRTKNSPSWPGSRRNSGSACK